MKIAFLSVVFASLALGADVKEGKVAKVVPGELEIYVLTADGKKHEYYFNPGTKLTKNGQTVGFLELKEGARVRVTAEKKGKRLDPSAVEILD